MSNTDSFISEVSEEVRKDKLYHYLRRYGWIAVLLVLLLVGGAAFREYQKAQKAARAQAVGDALVTALEEDDPAARAAAIADVSVDGPAGSVAGLMIAAIQQEADDPAAAVATLNAISTDPDAPQVYRDVAAFKAAMLDQSEARLTTLEALAEPGQPFRLLAIEQLAYASVDAGDVDGAVVHLQSILEDAAVTRGLQERAQGVLVALGQPLEEVIAPTDQVNE